MANANTTGAVNTSTASGLTEFVTAQLATQQTANIAANDHLKLDTVLASRGVSVALDVSTAYSNVTGAASIGRFTLKAGRLYRLRATIPYVLGSGATGALVAQFWDATANAAIPGSQSVLLVNTDASNDTGDGSCEAVFAPGVDTLVEVRIITATALTQIGTTGARTPIVTVETL